MTQKLAKSVKDLAKPCTDALSVIVKSVARECPECEGSGFEKEYEPLHEIQRDMDRDKPIEECPDCNGTGKISQQEMIRQAKESIAKKERGRYQLAYKKDRRTIVAEPRGWEWKPKVGECFYGLSKILHWIVNEKQCLQVTQHVEDHKLTPILEWEAIKGILEGMGCKVKVRDQEDFGKDCKYNCGIYTDKLGVGASAPTCQEAVMLAVDRLAKELK